MIEENLTPKEICSESGLIIKNGLELKLNYSRMVAPFKKAVRGIFFHHTGIPVPQGYVEMCGFLDTISENGHVSRSGHQTKFTSPRWKRPSRLFWGRIYSPIELSSKRMIGTKSICSWSCTSDLSSLASRTRSNDRPTDLAIGINDQNT